MAGTKKEQKDSKVEPGPNPAPSWKKQVRALINELPDGDGGLIIFGIRVNEALQAAFEQAKDTVFKKA